MKLKYRYLVISTAGPIIYYPSSSRKIQENIEKIKANDILIYDRLSLIMRLLHGRRTESGEIIEDFINLKESESLFYESILNGFNKILNSITKEELELIFESPNDVNWEEISKTPDLSEAFIKDFHNKIDWYYISEYQTLSENFIREFKDKVNWTEISKHQTLSESFIRDFADKVDWTCISEYQTLSESFIREFQDRVNWFEISFNTNVILSEKFKEEFKDYIETALPFY